MDRLSPETTGQSREAIDSMWCLIGEDSWVRISVSRAVQR